MLWLCPLVWGGRPEACVGCREQLKGRVSVEEPSPIWALTPAWGEPFSLCIPHASPPPPRFAVGPMGTDAPRRRKTRW